MVIRGGRKGKSSLEKLEARRNDYELSVGRQQKGNFSPNRSGPKTRFNRPGSLNRKKG